MSLDRRLSRALRKVRIPDEAEAEERSWKLVRQAYVERVPARPSSGSLDEL